MTRTEIPQRLESALSLTVSEAAIVARLYAAGNTWLSAHELNGSTAVLRGFRDGWDTRKAGAIKVHVHAIRGKLGAESVISFQGRGYTLGAAGIGAVRRALADCAVG